MRYIAVGVFVILAIYFLGPFFRDWGRQIVTAYRARREEKVDRDIDPPDEFNREGGKDEA